MELNRLPSSVKEDILARLPMLEAVRTSQLSREWRHRWKSVPCLSFDLTGFPQRPGEETPEFERRVVKAVSHALLLHAGPIHEFKLSTDLRSCPDVDVWVWAVSRKDVKRIVLDFWTGDPYRLPSGLFECQLLNHLELFKCVLRLPPMFKGFRDLVSLDLRRITFSGDDLQRLISSCPLLEILDLWKNVGCDEIRICAPRLRRLKLVGSFRYLHLDDTPVLATAFIDLSTAVPPRGHLHETGSRGNLIELFSALPCIEKLKMENHFLGVLSAGNIPERLPAALRRLKNIHMDVNLEDLKECMAALCLLRSCPFLETLKIHHCPSESPGTDIITEYFWEAKEGLDCKFNKLTSLEMPDVVGAGPEMAFMGFMLANAPKLLRFNVRLDKKVSDDASKFKVVTKSLLSCPRASARARIVLLE